MTEKDVNVLIDESIYLTDERNAGFGISDKIFALAIDKYHCYSVSYLVGPLLVCSIISAYLCSRQMSAN